MEQRKGYINILYTTSYMYCMFSMEVWAEVWAMKHRILKYMQIWFVIGWVITRSLISLFVSMLNTSALPDLHHLIRSVFYCHPSTILLCATKGVGRRTHLYTTFGLDDEMQSFWIMQNFSTRSLGESLHISSRLKKWWFSETSLSIIQAKTMQITK